MSQRILIVNRGEIAIRVAKAIRELGHIAVGVWTSSEPDAVHLQYCQEWVLLEGNGHAETYLNIDKILCLIKKYKIDAVHPGYGFLSENTAFVKALEKNKTIFIGPHSKAIELMGDKAVSKKIAKEAGIPIVPGTTSIVPTVQEAKEVAKGIGYPILLKAVAGGGGRGMRLCHNEAEVEKNFEAVGREALSSFGNAGLLVEKFIVNPRHIEVQLIGDKKGNIFHLFERECSIQRRHQKVIEEAPSPFIGDDEALREKICQTAVDLAKFVEYDSAGTVEFIMSEDKKFYFLEMNTRIQVEHPITEEITGIDLLVCMIQSALGDDIGIPNQQWISKSGHAIECRICAEDPLSLLPSPGKVTGFSTTFPQGVRFDHCLYPGLVVTPDFDPMVGKLIVKGITRKVAIRKMSCALDGLLLHGLKTNIPLHKVILAHEDFISAHFTTHFIDEKKPQQRVDISLDLDSIFTQISLVEARNSGV